MATKKIASKIKNKTNNVYVVIYEPTHFEFSQGISRTIKVFKNKKDAALYTDTRNFEFQAVCMSETDQYEHYVLTNVYKDQVVTMFDLRSAYAYLCDEFSVYNQKNSSLQPFSILSKINPFKYIRIGYCESLE